MPWLVGAEFLISAARGILSLALGLLLYRSTGQVWAFALAFSSEFAFSLVIQGIWTMLLTLSGSYNDLLDYVIFAVLLFYILTIAGIFRLRRTRPDVERPYRALGYPVLPAAYIAAAGLIEILLLLYKPNYTWPGLIIVLLGVPVYFIWRKKEVSA